VPTAAPASDSGGLRGQVREPVERLHFRQTEVQDLRAAARRHENIGRLDVTVHDAARMRRVQRVGDLDGEAEQRIERHRTAADRATSASVLRAARRRHTGRRRAADVVDRENVRVIQRRSRAGFLLEACQTPGSADKRRRQTLIATSRSSRASAAR
jgi:hypothetical protein